MLVSDDVISQRVSRLMSWEMCRCQGLVVVLTIANAIATVPASRIALFVDLKSVSSH